MNSGKILQISVKPSTPGEHGLPKISVPETEMRFGGVDGDYNTYHYEKRYIFHTIGDVESISGSYASISSSFETDFTGTVTSGIFTASKHFKNHTFLIIC